MSLASDKARLMQYKAQIVKLLGDPIKMRLAIVTAVTLVAALAIYMPFSDEIAQQQRLVAAEKNRLALVQDVENLRKQVCDYQSRIGDKSDTNEWVQYLLAGSRAAKVKLRNMESKEPQKVGPYKAVSLAIEVQGTYPQMKQFIEWLDRSDRLLRLDMMRLEKMPDLIVMKVYVLGLVRKSA
ncbi:MAG: hypothetical protein LLG01_02735 [Planctomycetaceae bacterium]|nr:hypothetical protein [Planctomycetaceae bacterium]